VYAGREVIRFSSLGEPGTDFTSIGYTYTEKGYIFGVLDGIYPFGVYQKSSVYAHHPPALFNNSTYGFTTLSKTNAGAFDFNGMDLWYLQYPFGGNINFQGYRGDTLVIATNFYFLPVKRMVRFTAIGFTNLTEVRWPASPPVQFDNVKLLSKSKESPSPAVRVADINSVIQLSASYLRVGTTNILQRSTDSMNWTNFYTFVPQATTLFLSGGIYHTDDPTFYYRIQLQE
jgi:hypothetical protein